MGDLGKKGSKGPDRVVTPPAGHNPGSSEGSGPSRLQPTHKTGTHGSNKGAH